MPLAHVEALSDDDGALVQPAEGPLVPSVSRKRLLPGDRSVVSFAQLAAVRQRLHRTVNSTCRCCRKVSPKHPDKKNCFAPFRGETMFGEIVSLRKLCCQCANSMPTKKSLGFDGIYFAFLLYWLTCRIVVVSFGANL